MDYKKQSPYQANLAIRGRYPSGSTVKPLTVLMGLEEEIIQPSTRINDKGIIQYDRNPNGDPIYMRNYGSKPYGPITLERALQVSSNVFMTEIALKMREKYGIYQTLDIMRYYDNMFGLGVATGVDLPEEKPGHPARLCWAQFRGTSIPSVRTSPRQCSAPRDLR